MTAARLPVSLVLILKPGKRQEETHTPPRAGIQVETPEMPNVEPSEEPEASASVYKPQKITTGATKAVLEIQGLYESLCTLTSPHHPTKQSY